ncbi:D-2-hydroxyglutarate dehydrogenase, mitochondrial precursor [Achlya hypogyna]|uniref:D-2-hydroxyglutarate dehydrogenase, mitochondrial n=1 Tax=Achlya hypogyna TaxID=1202772 RepID=A0A1V9YMH1_ACHHY|nr:D-2-hydroxyglutarate dehydrogenase, mitochondrial precursor [Achlya hypogyna]
MMWQPARRALSTVGIPRGAFAKLQDADVAHLRTVCPSVLTDPADIAPLNSDWLNKFHGHSKLVLRPKSTEEVAAVLKYCNDKKLAVVPQGGNTGLVGGSVPVHDEIILSLTQLNKIEAFDAVSGIIVCQAGCVLESLDAYAGKFGYLMPLDLGAKGTCQIGGNAATNAGGLRLLRYGSLHGSILGLEAVLADGTILDCLSTMRKDNTGYDLKQLFIGSEGTLGVITKLSVLTPPRSSARNVALLGCASFKRVKRAFVEARRHLGEILSAVEFLDRQSLDLVLSQQPSLQDPLGTACPFYVLLETSGSNAAHDMEKLEGYLEQVMASGTAVDGTVAQDAAQANKLFGIREDVPLALTAAGYVYKYDLSVPIDEYYAIVNDTRARLAHLNANVVAYGHLGDFNIHLNVSTPAYDDAVQEALEPFLFNWTAQRRGSISAEHGIGTHKPQFLHLSKSPEAIRLMRAMKMALDPNGILNPYKKKAHESQSQLEEPKTMDEAEFSRLLSQFPVARQGTYCRIAYKTNAAPASSITEEAADVPSKKVKTDVSLLSAVESFLQEYFSATENKRISAEFEKAHAKFVSQLCLEDVEDMCRQFQ